MNLLIEAVNLKSGGGIAHLKNILKYPDVIQKYFKKIIVLAPRSTLNHINESTLLTKIEASWADKSLIHSALFQKFFLKQIIKEYNIDLIFNPNGTYFGKTKAVLMSHNMLIHEKNERKRYGFNFTRFKFKILDIIQSYAFKRADGIIFLSNYAREIISKKIKLKPSKYPIIHHGIEKRFKSLPRIQKNINSYDNHNPFKFIYVSNLTVYKHQYKVVKTFVNLIKKGFPVSLYLVGGKYEPYFKKIQPFLNDFPNNIKYLGMVSHKIIHDLYKSSDGIIFASSCENMPNILIEGMSSGVPILCSKLGPMSEFLGDSEFYINPENEKDIFEKVVFFMNLEIKRKESAEIAYNLSEKYNWKKCSEKTFKYLNYIAVNGF